MNMNVVAFENLMVERRTEVEKGAMSAWQWNTEKNKKNLISGIANKFSLLKAKAQAQPTVCCSCC